MAIIRRHQVLTPRHQQDILWKTQEWPSEFQGLCHGEWCHLCIWMPMDSLRLSKCDHSRAWMQCNTWVDGAAPWCQVGLSQNWVTETPTAVGKCWPTTHIRLWNGSSATVTAWFSTFLMLSSFQNHFKTPIQSFFVSQLYIYIIWMILYDLLKLYVYKKKKQYIYNIYII